MLDGVGLAQCVFFERGEILLACFDGRSDATVPGRITILRQFGQTAIGANFCGNFQAAGEGILAPDVRIKEINRLEAFASDLCVKVESARREPTHFQDCLHHVRSE